MASRRAVIVLTESQSLTALWRAALSSADQPAQDVVVVFLDDERWQRAACLPFTCEISRIGGGIAAGLARFRRSWYHSCQPGSEIWQIPVK